ncbi:MAG: transglutaminase-like domain-containing protein [Planctomycetota bacterium]|jgi:hypothetical protein
MRTRILLGAAALTGFAALAPAGAVPQPPRHDDVHWYWELAGEVPIGRIRAVESKREDGSIVTESAAQFRWWQSGDWHDSSWSRKIVESADGKMRSFYAETVGGGTVVVGEGTVEGAVLKLTVSERGKEPKTHDVPWDNPVLGPTGVEKLRAAKGYTPGTRYSYWTWDWDRWAPAHLEATVERTADVVRGPSGEETAARLLVMAIPPTKPVKALREWWKDGECIRQWTDSAGTATRLLADRDLVESEGLGMKAQYAVDRSVKLSSGSPMVPRPSSVTRAVYRMGFKDGALGEIDLNGPGQKTKQTKDGSYVIAVEAQPLPKSGPKLPIKAPKGWEASRADAYWLGVESEAIQAAAKAAVGGETNGAKAVRKILAAVHARLTPTVLNAGIATAGEAWRQQHGDALEHAVLTIALCRAAGIPARLAGGLRYATAQGNDAQNHSLMSYHAWAEVYLGKWVGVDAMIAHGTADAARIRFGVTQLADENPESALINIGTCVDRIDLKILEAVQGKVKLGADAPRYAGSTMQSAAWGVRITVPQGWEIGPPAPGVISAIGRAFSSGGRGRGRSMNIRAGTVGPHDTAWTQLYASLLGGFFVSSLEEVTVDGRAGVVAKMEPTRGAGYSPLTAYVLDGETLFTLEYAGRAQDGKAAFDQILKSWKFTAK